jgi:hypothetical protein
MTRVRYDQSTLYCSVEDVERLFRVPEAFGQNDNPSDRDAYEFILEASEQIDDYTRQAWRENEVKEEHHNFDSAYRWDSGRAVKLNKMDVRTPLDSSKGDKLEIFDGGDWDDWVADSNRTEGRGNGDYWLDGHSGQLFVFKLFAWRSSPQMRVSYRYGDPVPTETKTLKDGTDYDVITQPRSIRKACAKLAAIELISSDFYTSLIPGSDGGMSADSIVQQWEDDIYGNQNKDGLLSRHKNDMPWVEPY